MIVADTSAWVEFLRATGHPVGVALRELINGKEEVAVTEVIIMELLAGARPGRDLRELRARLLGFRVLTLEGLGDFEEAAQLYRSCRAGGHVLRGLTDCLVAVPVLREGAALLHNDRDLAAIAAHSGMKVHSVSAAS